MASFRPFTFLTARQIETIYRLCIAPLPPTQPSLLASAVQSPVNIAHYTGEKNVFSLAGQLSTKMMKNHAFGDGNKRIGLLASDMFLRGNGWALQRYDNIPGKKEEKSNGRCDEMVTEEALVKVVRDQLTAEDLGRLYARLAERV